MTSKICSYHEKPYDGSSRRDDGTERRWRSSNDGKNNKYILACTCGKGEK